MGSCHSSNTKIKSRKKICQSLKSVQSLNQSTLIDDQSDSLTLKNNDLSAYIDLNSSLFQKNSVSMSSFSSSKSSESSKQPRAIPVLNKLVYRPRDPHIVTSASSVVSAESKTTKSAIEFKTQIKIEETKNLKRVSNITRREFSPFRSFLKPPNAVVNKNNDKNFSSNSSLTKHNQSSSLSSLSSTSSSISNNKVVECKPKSALVQPKKVPKSPIKSSQLPKTSNISISNSLAKSENVDKQNSQNKRLFSPYKFSSTLTKSTVLTENINRDNSTSVDVKKPESTCTANSLKENTQTGLSKLKFSYNKMPAASKNNIKTSNQSKVNKSVDKSVDQSGLLKRDDSAYNSSTSSTVSSSNDAEETKKENGSDEKQTNQSNIEESVDELNQLIVSSSSINSTLNQDVQEMNSILKPPSNLPPVENGEMIVLDLDTYRLLMQDLQSCKIILHKLGAILKEPSLLSQTSEDNQSNDVKQNEFLNPLLESLYQNHVSESVEKTDQSTQTDLV